MNKQEVFPHALAAPPLRLLYVMNDFPSLYQGTVINEIRILREMGCEIHVLALRRPVDPHLEASQSLAAITTYGLDMTGGPFSVLAANLKTAARIGPRRYWQAWRLSKQFHIMENWRGFIRLVTGAEKLRALDVQHVHAHWANEATEMAWLLSSLLGLPLSFTGHAVDLFVPSPHLEEKLQAARFMVTVSDYNKQYLVSRYGARLDDKIHVIYPFIDLARFTARAGVNGTHGANGTNGTNGTNEANKANGAGRESRPVMLVSIGRLVAKKGYRFAIQAAKSLKAHGYSFTWYLVGDGEDRASLEAEIAANGVADCVQLTGALAPAAVKALLDKATVFVLPSIIAPNGDREGMPQVLIEAMATGVPVVATTAFGTRELVRDGAGLLVAPGDSEALADAIEQVLLMSTEARQEMGRRGHCIVAQEFNWQLLGSRLRHLMEASALQLSRN